MGRVGGLLRGVVFGVISFYWGSGATFGLDTIGGKIEQMARADKRRPSFVAVWGRRGAQGRRCRSGLGPDLTVGRRLARRPMLIFGRFAAVVAGTIWSGPGRRGRSDGERGGHAAEAHGHQASAVAPLGASRSSYWEHLFAVAIRGFTRSGGSLPEQPCSLTGGLQD